MGLTRYITAFYDELALTLKLRLITPDRPGVGDSEPYADGTTTPLSWPGKSPLLTLRALADEKLWAEY
jgi:pimeloyl-ACP methyl ester carboxylesterase